MRRPYLTLSSSAVILFLAVMLCLVVVPGNSYAAQYCAKYSPENISGMTAGWTRDVNITVENCGDLTWDPVLNFRLSYHWYKDSAAVEWDGIRTTFPYPIPKGQSIPLKAKVKAPDAKGTYILKWDMVQEAVTWFSDQGVPTGNQTIKVSLLHSGLSNPYWWTSIFWHLFEPDIKAVYNGQYTDYVQPNDQVHITGSNFGQTQGESVVGLAYPDGNAVFSSWIPVSFWSDGLIIATIPDFSGFTSKPDARIWLNKADGHSTSHTVWLQPIYEVMTLPMENVSVDYCSATSNCDRCNGIGDCGCFTAAATLSACHESWCCFSGASGTDTYSATLLNGWYVDSCFCSGLNECPCPSGWSQFTYAVKWSAGLGSSINYAVSINIRGPRGVPIN